VRIAFVIQRYGEEVSGGAERHCRLLAERLAARHQVEVFTTRALDYLEWANHYPAGTARVGAIPVHRFSVRRRRDRRAFAAASDRVFDGAHTRADEEAWVRLNGPDAPELLAAVAAARERFERFFFYCYRYAHSYLGLPSVRDRALLVPTAEEDPAIRLSIFRDFFRLPRGIVYLTPEERTLVEAAAGGPTEGEIAGTGMEAPAPDGELDFAARHRLARPFVLYLGRVDRNKGCATLFSWFQRFAATSRVDVDLVLAGAAALEIPEHPRIRHVGVVSEAEKAGALRQCRLLVMPSPYESLSIAVLEAWRAGTPVLANARCKVLLGQCRRSNGGLCYERYAEFAAALELLLEHPDLGRRLGAQGRAYVERECDWDRVLSRIEALLARTA
jgi:glycosyltransferase involved in cell wall biosynthesis